jgi:hypothetical protein
MRQFALLAACWGAADAQAQDIVLKSNTDWLWFAKSQVTHVVVNNSAKGCWTNTQAARSAVERELVREGMEIGDNAATIIVLSAMSYKAPDLNFCALSFSFRLLAPKENHWWNGDLHMSGAAGSNTIIFERGIVLGGQPSYIDHQIREAVQVAARDMLDEAAKEKSAVLKELSSLGNKKLARAWRNWVERKW